MEHNFRILGFISMKKFKDVIDSWPSRREMAEDLIVRVKRINNWHERNSIPSTHWMQIVSSADKRGIQGVTLEVLADIKNRQSSKKRVA